MVYTDGIHLVATTVKELHEFAQMIGLKYEWFQDRWNHPHYDTIAKSKKRQALSLGAIKVSSREIVTMFNEGKLEYYFPEYCRECHAELKEEEYTRYCENCLSKVPDPFICNCCNLETPKKDFGGFVNLGPNPICNECSYDFVSDESEEECGEVLPEPNEDDFF